MEGNLASKIYFEPGSFVEVFSFKLYGQMDRLIQSYPYLAMKNDTQDLKIEAFFIKKNFLW